jgi:riboflavin biosynthesis pyrimidine reductase
VLCEGGPRLNRALLADGLLDELFLTLSPLVTGDDSQPAIVAGGVLPAPARLALRSVATADGELYLRYSV